MTAKRIITFFALVFVSAQLSGVFCLDLQSLQNDCVHGRSLNATQKLQCVASSEISIHMVKEGSQILYCIRYEKRSGDKNASDILSLELHEDYELKYVSDDCIVQTNITLIYKFISDRVKSYLQ